MIKTPLERLATERNQHTNEIFTPNDYYGHASLIKKYCGISEKSPLPGIYPHGLTIMDNVWAPELRHPIPFLLLKSKSQSDVYSKYSDKDSWIIGAPNYYAAKLIENELKEIKANAKGTVVFPYHSTHHVTINYDFAEFVKYLKNLTEKFKPITICLGWRDIQLKMHEQYLAHGFECTTAGHMYDHEFFFRLLKIIASHKSAIINDIGTAAFYCAAMNLPVILFKQSIETRAARPDQPDYLLQESQPRPYLPIVEEFVECCKNPNEHAANQQKYIAKLLLGFDYLKEPDELRSIFESLWRRKEMNPLINDNYYIFEGSFNKVIDTIGKKLPSYPRRNPGRLKIDGIPFSFADLHSFYHHAIQIFKSDFYSFKTDKDNPVIFDCGANVGLASIYFATKYPNAIIHAFEADPVIAQMLAENINALGLKMVNVHQQAVWVNEEGVCFNTSGDDSGFICVEEHKNSQKIPSIRLKQIIENQHIDLLKLDIEGAEYDVIRDCGEVLANVKNMIIDVHKFRDNNVSLGDILGVLEKNHFEYIFGDFHAAEWLKPSLIPPFAACKTNKYIITIYAWQPKIKKRRFVKDHELAEQAINKLNIGENSEAISLIKSAIQNEPEEKGLYYALAIAHAREKNFLVARKMLAQIPKGNHIYSKASHLLNIINNEIKEK